MEQNTHVEITVRPLSADVVALVREAEKQPDAVDMLIVETPAQAQAVAELLRGLKSRATALEDKRKSITQPLDEAKRKIMDEFRPALDALETAEKRVKAKLLTYQREAEERQRAQAREAEAEAEAARKRAREADEEAERLAAEGAPVEQVIDALDRAQAATSEASVAEVSSVVAATEPAAPKITGTSSRGTWKVKTIDVSALIAAAATNLHLHAYLLPNEQALNAFARAAKSAATVPGVVFEEVRTIAAPRR